ncbi:MAG: transposase, partial [Thermoguttaceae bacterium]|nr:transposase [Thermoguttaceae bacterium]
LMDRAYEGDATRQTARDVGLEPVVPPKRNRREPWDYDKKLYQRRNEVERFFRRIKDFRRIATRCDKLDVTFSTFLNFVTIVILLKH